MKESQLEPKTAIATNDYVRMVDENNNSVKIKKDSFMAAIRDALPSIISDGETGGGSVLSIINGALKSRTDANLASVLGADITFVAPADGNWGTGVKVPDGVYSCFVKNSNGVVEGLAILMRKKAHVSFIESTESGFKLSTYVQCATFGDTRIGFRTNVSNQSYTVVIRKTSA